VVDVEHDVAHHGRDRGARLEPAGDDKRQPGPGRDVRERIASLRVGGGDAGERPAALLLDQPFDVGAG
jgi:hypothetical protein